MSSSARLFAVLFFMLWCIPVSLRAQSIPKPPAKTPTGSVSGRVMIKDKPAPGITVGLRISSNGMPGGKTYRGVTDQDGVYHITSVPAGTYDVIPAALAYVVADGNTQRGKNVVVAEDETVEDINFSLVRGGVITGKITDGEGRPLIQQQVSLYRSSDFAGDQQRQIYPANTQQTDDRGIYRFFGLPAGRYKLASGRGEDTFVAAYNPTRIVYKQVFYPNETDHNKATVLDVKEASEAKDIDISLGTAVQTFSVSGRIVDSERNLPVSNLRFAFQKSAGDRFEMYNASAVTNGQGEFAVDGMIPGKYAAMPFGGQDQESRMESIWFEVVDRDIAGLTIRMIKASSISGVIVIEPENQKALAKLAQMQLRGYVTAASGAPSAGNSAWAAIGPDGSFRLPGLSPGSVNFWLTSPQLGNTPKGWAIMRTEHNGVVMPRGIEIKDGDQLTGVRIIVSYGTASLRGTVKIENGSLPEGTRMFVRMMKQGAQQQLNLSNSIVDARGQFLLEGIPPGFYEVIVTAFAGNNTQGPRRQITGKREVSIQDGVVNEVTITIDLTPAEKP